MSSCIDLTFGQEKRQSCVCLMVGNTAVSLAQYCNHEPLQDHTLSNACMSWDSSVSLTLWLSL